VFRIFAAVVAVAIVAFLGSALINETDATGTHIASAASPANAPAQAD
jgi:hypothetical protein